MLQHRHIVITGGASGIGAATVDIALQRGARVHSLDLNATPLGRPGLTASVVDITDLDQVRRAVREAHGAMGGIDGLVNVAGLGGSAGSLQDTDLGMWRKIIDVNLMGTLHVTALALPMLRAAAQASIVNISSGAALKPFPGSGAYAAAKRGVLALTQVWAMELGPTIRVNAVCPGAVETPMLRERNEAATSGGRAPLSAEMYALKRFAQPAEVATAIAFLLGADASFITGVTLPVDGGRSYH